VLHNHYLTPKEHMVELNDHSAKQGSLLTSIEDIRKSFVSWHFKVSGLQCQQNLDSSSVRRISWADMHFVVQDTELWQKYIWRDQGNDMALFRLLEEAE